MLSLLVLAVPAPDDAVHAEATPRGLNFATVPNEPVVPERMTYTGGRWERLFGTPLPAAAPAMSCRHPTFVDGANPERMRSGSYCCDKSNGCTDASFASCTSWTSGGGGFTTSTAACPANNLVDNNYDNKAVHPDGTGFKTEWCGCSSLKPQRWHVVQGWIEGFKPYC